MILREYLLGSVGCVTFQYQIRFFFVVSYLTVASHPLEIMHFSFVFDFCFSLKTRRISFNKKTTEIGKHAMD